MESWHLPTKTKQNNKKSNIDSTFCKKILQIHKKSPIFGCKIGDKRGGKNNIHSWDIGYNGIINNDEKQLMNQIMLNRRNKHWAEKKQREQLFWKKKKN